MAPRVQSLWPSGAPSSAEYNSPHLATVTWPAEHALRIQEGLPPREWDWKPYEAAPCTLAPPAGRQLPSALAGGGVAQPAAGQAQEAPKIRAPKRRRGAAIKK